MTLVFIIIGAAAALELILYTKLFWRFHRPVASLLVIVNAFTIGACVVWQLQLFSVLFGLIGLYRLFNMFRMVQQRMHATYLQSATRRTGIALMGGQAVMAAGWWAWNTWHMTGHVVWALAGAIQATAAVLLLWSVRRNLRHMQWPSSKQHYSDKELPTVTAAIPARNETEDLQRCLQTLVASDYPKLEIIVLDDCSQMRRTPEIIRDFAHAGVRFVQGHEPSAAWLPKNEAYHRLVHEASGSYILFCGVDVRFRPHTIRAIMTTMLDRNKMMVSILPRREQAAFGHLSLVQAMRYWWELAPPRRLFNRPPVLSSCWVIQTNSLKKMGGFAAIARAIVPEAYFARELTKSDGYSFLRASEALGVSSNKHVSEQRATAVRTRYPQVHRRPEQVALLTLIEVFMLLTPVVLVVAGYWISIGIVAHILAAVTSVLLVLTYQSVVLHTHVNTWWFSVIGHPFMVLVDIVLLHYSMWKFEFSEVDWKGRNVCVPVMHIVPKLPDA